MNMFQRLARKFAHAFRGIIISIREEGSMITHFIIATIVVGIGMWTNIETLEWVAIILTLSLVIGMEMLNTGLENLVDLFEFKYNGKAGKIKDIGAAATLITTVGALAVGILVILPAVLEKVGG